MQELQLLNVDSGMVRCTWYNIEWKSLHFNLQEASDIVSSNPSHDEINSILPYVIQFVSGLRQDGGFLQVLRFLCMCVCEEKALWTGMMSDSFIFII